ncbi:MAG: hypothetical protein LBU65_13350 [Planctomycetaceae bacterium]|nr:hypothetical protein [Planctomycetaceae bacterium]
MYKFTNVVLALSLISVGVGVNVAIYPIVWKMCEDIEFTKDEQTLPSTSSSSETNVVLNQTASETKPPVTTPVVRNETPARKRWQPSEELIVIPPTSPQPSEQVDKAASNVTDKIETLHKTSQPPVTTSPFEHAVQVQSDEQPESPFARAEVQQPQPAEPPFQPLPHNLPLPANNSASHPAQSDIDKTVEPVGATRDSHNDTENNNFVKNIITWEQPPRIPDEPVTVLASNTAPSTVNAIPQPIYANQVIQPPPVTKSSGTNVFTPRDISESLMKRTPIISAPANDRESWLGKP